MSVGYITSRLLSSFLVITLSSVVLMGFLFQAVTGEQPCPLCFLQRLAMAGVGMGQLLNFQRGMKMKHHAFSLLYCFIGGAIALRQISLHVCPDFPTFGTPVFGLSLYTWSFIVFVCSAFVIMLMLFLYHPKWEIDHCHLEQYAICRRLRELDIVAIIYLQLIVLANFVDVLWICKLGVCPDNP